MGDAGVKITTAETIVQFTVVPTVTIDHVC